VEKTLNQKIYAVVVIKNVVTPGKTKEKE